MSTKENLRTTPPSGTHKTPTTQPSRAKFLQSGLNLNPAKIQKGPKTRITIHYNVGFSNSIYIRGEGGPLSWDKGLLLKNVGADEWVWETTEPFTSCQFKILINDSDFENGENHTITCGASAYYTPQFN